RGERDENGFVGSQFTTAQAVLLFRQHNDRPAFGRLVGERSELSSIGHLSRGDARRRNKLRGLAVAERDRSRLIEEERVHVPSRFHGAPGHRQHVVLHHAVHAGNADRGQQTANGGRSQTNQQGDEYKYRLRRSRVNRERLQRNHSQQENNGQARQQNVERDLVRSLLPLGTLDQSDHSVEEGFSRIRSDANFDYVGQHARAASDRRPVSSGFADHGRGFPRNRRFVHRGNAFDDFAIARDEFARGHHHDIPRTKLRTRHRFYRPVRQQALSLGFRPGFAQRVRLRFAAPLGHGFREIRKQHREPKPERDLQVECEALLLAE